MRDNPIKRSHLKKKNRGKPGMKAMGASMGLYVEIIHASLTRQEPFDWDRNKPKQAALAEAPVGEAAPAPKAVKELKPGDLLKPVRKPRGRPKGAKDSFKRKRRG